jgi:hypothetical protein
MISWHAELKNKVFDVQVNNQTRSNYALLELNRPSVIIVDYINWYLHEDLEPSVLNVCTS